MHYWPKYKFETQANFEHFDYNLKPYSFVSQRKIMPKVKLFDKEEVLQKAMMLFWRKGYHDTSIQDLVEHLGISRSSLYDTFKGKKQLFEQAFKRYSVSNVEGFRNFISTQDDVRGTLRSVFQKIISDDKTDEDCKGCFVVNTTTELVPAEPLIKTLITAHKETMEQIFLTFLQRGVETGQISPNKDIKTISHLLFTLMTGFRVVGKTRPDLDELHNSVEVVLSLLD